MRVTGIPGLMDGADREQPAAAFGQSAHQEHHGVDESPGEVAADRADKQHPDLLTLRHRAERAGEGQRHDQAEEDLGDAGEGIEHPFPFRPDLAHGVAPAGSGHSMLQAR